MIERNGLFCAVSSDRASHFFVTIKGGGKVDPNRLTQVGRAMKDLGIKIDPGLFGARPWPRRAELSHLARTAATRASTARHTNRRGDQRVPSRLVH